MNSQEFFLWLNGYLEALESEGITSCKIENIRRKMEEVKNRPNQERIVFGPNVNQQSSYAPKSQPQSFTGK
tara:strand:- start:300 stop:512 length:213 start_codon:yes stop_codon:yes gene_type:complete